MSNSLELSGGIKVLNPVPQDPRNKTASLDDISNDATLYVGFSPIFNEEDGETYTVTGGDSTNGWVFELSADIPQNVAVTDSDNNFSTKQTFQAEVEAATFKGNGSNITGVSKEGHNHDGSYEPADNNIQSHITDTSSNPHGVTKGDVGLGSVTNDAQIPLSEKGSVSGVAELDSSGKVPASQLPSFVDDVEEYPDFASLPAVGESSKIYITTNDNKTYRWGGSSYVPLSSGVVLGETSETAYRGDRGKVAYDYSQVGHVPNSAKGSANGVAQLDANGRIPASQAHLSGLAVGINSSSIIDSAYENKSIIVDSTSGDITLTLNSGLLVGCSVYNRGPNNVLFVKGTISALTSNEGTKLIQSSTAGITVLGPEYILNGELISL